MYILRSWIEPTVGNGAAKEEGTREGLVSNTGFLCLTWVFPEEFFPGLDSRFLGCLDGSGVTQAPCVYR